jgi:hypothetical protein
MPSSPSQNFSVANRFRRILANASGVWKALRAFSKLSAPDHDSSGSAHPQDNARDRTQVRRNVPSPIHVIVDASPPTPTPNKDRESREERAEGREKKKVRIETWTFFALVVYTVVTAGMWWATKKAADSAADSAKLNRQLAEGTQAAVISWTIENGYMLPPHEFGFKIYFSNAGHVTAQEFTADVTITREKLMEHTAIGEPIHWRISQTPVRTGEYGNGPTEDLSIDFDMSAATRFEQTIKVEAKGSYDNGFGRKVPVEFCKSYVSGVRNMGFIDCQDVDAYVRRSMNAKQAADTDAQKQK